MLKWNFITSQLDVVRSPSYIKGLFSATAPVVYSNGNTSLNYNTTNLKVTANQLNTIQDIATTSSPTFAAATIGSVAIPGVYNAVHDPKGFVDRTATLSFVDATRTFTITGAHDIYINGVKYSKTTTSLQISDTTGMHYIYYDASATLVETTPTFPGTEYCLVAFVYWNTTIDKGLLADERHGIGMDWKTHSYLHNTVGTRYQSGLAGTFTNTTFSIESGVIWDEDIKHELATQTSCHVLYKNGTTNWEWDAAQTTYYKLNGANLRYNNGNALADVGANRYMAMWCFATSSVDYPIVFILGQREDVTLSDARLNNTFASLSLGSLPYVEMKVLYRVILRNTGTPPTYTETEDLRSISNLPGGTYTATSHLTLSDLAVGDSGHTQFVMLAGRTGDQTVAGTTSFGTATDYCRHGTNGDTSFAGTAGFYPRRIRQDDQPASGTGATQIDVGEMILWVDSNDSDRTYLIYNDATSSIKKVELT